MHELFPSAFMTAHETSRIRAVKNDKKEAFPMRAAKMKDRPGFLLMKQSDVQSIYYMQMPRWLFSDPRYADI